MRMGGDGGFLITTQHPQHAHNICNKALSHLMGRPEQIGSQPYTNTFLRYIQLITHDDDII